MKPISQILKSLEFKENELKTTIKNLNKTKAKISQLKKTIEKLNEAQVLIIKIGEETTQETIKYIEETITLALQSVFGTDYSLSIEIENKRDQQEIKFLINDKGMQFQPKDDLGGVGVVDVIAFALRLVIWSLESSSAPPVLIFDEPFKNVSPKYLPKVYLMVKEITDLLEIQIIMVTHTMLLKENADNIIMINTSGDYDEQ